MKKKFTISSIIYHLYFFQQDFIATNFNDSLPLIVNTSSPFTIHFALWPYVGLLSLVAIVWLIVHISKLSSSRRSLADEQAKFNSIYSTQTNAFAVVDDASNTISQADV